MKNYATYLTFRNLQHGEHAISYPVPQEPWTKIAADLFRLYGYYDLLVADYKN